MRLVWSEVPDAHDEEELMDTEQGAFEDLVWTERWEVTCVHVNEGARVAQQVELRVRGMSFEAQLCRNCRRLAA